MISERLMHNKDIHTFRTLFVSLYSWLTIGCIAGLLFVSCKNESSIKSQGLNGKWEIYSASRNGNETPYLRGGYFIFDHKGQLTVNITGTDETSPYLISDNVISLENKKEYTIRSLRKDSMDIHFVMNPESEFMFFLKKSTDEKH